MARFLGSTKSPIARALPNKSLAQWREHAPKLQHVDEHLQRVLACAPEDWRKAIEKRFAYRLPTVLAAAMTDAEFLQQPPEWAQAWDLLQALADFEDEFGGAGTWSLTNAEICDLAQRLADDVTRTNALARRCGTGLDKRLDDVRRFVRKVGIHEDKPIEGEGGIARACDALWWRRQLRKHVARTVEGGSVRLGRVHVGTGGYVSNRGLGSRRAQLKRNAEALERSLFRNEAGQVWSLAELALKSTANPVIRGGELMTRIRGAEEYADARAHVGLFLTLTAPSRFHAKRRGGGEGRQGWTFDNRKYCGATPRETQAWLNDKWAKVRAKLGREGVKMYGLRVAEPHHDATPHWHMLVWAEDEADARAIEAVVREYWLSDAGDERGARDNRINVKRLTRGGAAGYVAKYIAKSVGHVALAEHMDVVDGQQLSMDFGPVEPGGLEEKVEGHHRVDAWAATWGIRQFQAFGMPSVTVWRELRRVTPDQLELFAREGDRQTVIAYQACHKSGNLKADWRLFMEQMGGHALPRCRWHLRPVRNHVERGQTNKYGELLKVGEIYGVVAQRGRMHGRCLVSRRMAWKPEANTPATLDEAANRPAMPVAWTGFTNCTARLGHSIERQVFGRGDHEVSDWATPDVVSHFRALREMEARQ